MSNNVAVLYKSKYGTTRTYAKWIADKVHGDLYGIDNISFENLNNYDFIVFAGALYAGKLSSVKGIKRFYKKHQEKLKVLSISLDVDKRNLKNVERNDSVFWPDYCDFNAWNSPLIRLFHITDIPCCFFVGPDHRIIATGSDFEKEIQPVIEKTLNLK